MDVYYLVILVTFVLCYLIKVPIYDRKGYTIKVILVFVPILIYGALRVDFGFDYTEYERLYYLFHNNAQNISSEEHVEVGYQWLNYIMPSWRSLLILVSTTVIVAYVILYSKYVHPSMLMLALFFTFFYPEKCFFIEFVTMRNGLAIAATWLCLPLIKDRRYIIVIAVALLFSTLHTSALFFLPLALIIGRNSAWSKKEIIIWIISFIILIFSSIANIVDTFAPLVEMSSLERYQEILKEGDSHSSWLNGIANVLLMLIVIKWAYDRREVLTPIQNTISRLCLLYLSCPFMGFLGRTRMTYYYIPFYIICITYIWQDKTLNRSLRYFFVFLSIAIMFYATFGIWMGNQYFVFDHYHSIFSK